MRSRVIVFYLQDRNKGINERSELLPAAPPSPSIALATEGFSFFTDFDSLNLFRATVDTVHVFS
jgi:hypothetical protein